MAERAHSQAIAARNKLLAEQARKREQLAAELAEAEAAYREWVSPKTRFDAAKNAKHAFDNNAAAVDKQTQAQIAAAADPRISAAIESLMAEQEQRGHVFSVLAGKMRSGRINAPAFDARVKAIRAAINELQGLLHIECSDVPAAISAIMRKIPSVVELELA